VAEEIQGSRASPVYKALQVFSEHLAELEFKEFKEIPVFRAKRDSKVLPV
jgi:hypothetical protein